MKRRENAYQVIAPEIASYCAGWESFSAVGAIVEVTRPLKKLDELYLLVHGGSRLIKTQGVQKEPLFMTTISFDETSPKRLLRLAERSFVVWISANNRNFLLTDTKPQGLDQS